MYVSEVNHGQARLVPRSETVVLVISVVISRSQVKLILHNYIAKR